MAKDGLNVQGAGLENAAKTIDDKSAEYEKLYKKMESVVTTLTTKDWQDEASKKALKKFNDFLEAFKAMNGVMTESKTMIRDYNSKLAKLITAASNQYK